MEKRFIVTKVVEGIEYKDSFVKENTAKNFVLKVMNDFVIWHKNAKAELYVEKGKILSARLISDDENGEVYLKEVKDSYMSLQNFFRLITISIFQEQVTYYMNSSSDENGNYDNIHFYCPKIICNDGFSVSFQISHNSYCGTENGYRKFGYTWEYVEFGFPSEEEELLLPYSECETSTLNSVGCVPIEVAQKVVDKHNGINFDKTLSQENFNSLIKLIP